MPRCIECGAICGKKTGFWCSYHQDGRFFLFSFHDPPSNCAVKCSNAFPTIVEKHIHCSILVKLCSSSQSLWVKTTNIWKHNLVNCCFVVAVLGGAYPRIFFWTSHNVRNSHPGDIEINDSSRKFHGKSFHSPFQPSRATICKCFPVSTPRKINMEHNHGGLEDHFPF